MPITNGYCTLSEVKAALRISDNTDDALLENAIEGASRRIDGYCDRFFYQKSATAQFFTRYEYKLDVTDFISITTLKTDDDGDGTYENTWSASEYYFEPTNTSITGIPYRRIVAVNGSSFPIFNDPTTPPIQINATWGWSSIPDDVREACVLLAMRGFARYNAALGIVGFADMAITVRAVDPDVRDMLNPYRLAVAV
jgi:hypothetical protein